MNRSELAWLLTAGGVFAFCLLTLLFVLTDNRWPRIFFWGSRILLGVIAAGGILGLRVGSGT